MKRKKAASGTRRFLSLNVKFARTIVGWSQETLALHCGLKRTYIGALERGDVNPGVDNVDRIAGGLGLPMHVLLMEPDAAQPLMYRQLGNLAAANPKVLIKRRQAP